MSDLDLWIGTSWKMNKTLAEAKNFSEALRETEKCADPRIQRFVIPPFTVAREVKEMLAETQALVGAQNMHWEDAGPWTGEVSAPMLVDCRLDIVELGHSERRTHFGETDEMIGLKVSAAIRNGLVPLICVGETQSEKTAGQADAALARQIAGALAWLPENRVSRVLIAYEPVWAIGADGQPADPAYANARQAMIKSEAANWLGTEPHCLYGGSVTTSNCTALIAQPNVDGLFVGRAAWDASGYLEILRLCTVEISRRRTRM